jgi:hypothetical protein
MIVVPPVGLYLSRGGPGGHCQYPVTGVPHPPMSRKRTWEDEHRLHSKGWATGHKGPNSSNRTMAADSLPTWERVRCLHVSPRGALSTGKRSPGPPNRVRGLHVPPGPLNAQGTTLRRRGPGPPRVPHGCGRESSARSSPTYRIKCGWLKHALPLQRVGSF